MTAEKLPTGIKPEDILPELPKAAPNIQYKIEKFDDCERDYFQRLLVACRGNISKAVYLSGVPRSTIYRKIAIYKIQRPN